ncbi:MAG: hypothetical protein Q8Q09_03185 [Deltaproteobacteria bacterium]|nr:hypothetical protein [Deltaproteobacteria bacterium]
MKRAPQGYRGLRHETIGADILAVLDALTFPRGVLGDAVVDELEKIGASQWYPIDQLLNLLELLDKKVGPQGLRKTGRALFRRTHQKRTQEMAKCGRDIVYGIDGMYRFANRGIDIGGWNPVQFDAQIAVLEKSTPHHCMLEEGILDGALVAVGATSTVSQSQCFRKGAAMCIFEVRPLDASKGWLAP